ncbi:MAG: nuclear transport factor 2 family protein [Gemmatimonadaceae bacterium]
MSRNVSAIGAAFIALTACTPKVNLMSNDDLTIFANRYAAAWSGKDPVKFASFYDENGSLIVNGAASVGRAAITATARAYMAAFPDMVVRLDSLHQEKDQTIFHWTWTGTNTGPGGTGKAVNLRGYERWTIGPNGLIAKSDGHFDNDEYQRQLKGTFQPNP